MNESQGLHPSLKEAIKSHCDPEGYASFFTFMNQALYHPDAGYYTQKRTRVGKDPQADFYTASSLGAVFAELVLEVAATQLQGFLPSETTFVELGAEPGDSIFDTQTSPFKEHITLRLGDSLSTPPSPSVLFSNELLDAQPFHRFRFHKNKWHELGIQLDKNSIKEALLPNPTPEAALLMSRLPRTSSEGYTVDIPSGAEQLIERLITPSWEGLLLFFDYGKSTASLLHETPQGTARAYTDHKQSNDILANAGNQDITCHIGWDWIKTQLERLGFQNVLLESQEACFMKRAQQTIARIITHRPGELTPERHTLQELIHPSHLGQKFQALSGTLNKQ